MCKVSIRQLKAEVKETILYVSLELREKLQSKDTNLGDSNLQMEFKAIGLDASPEGASIEEKRKVLRTEP